VEHVALGSDYDGVIQAPFDTSDMALITQELMAAGFNHQEIRKIMGENVVNFLRQNLP
jgi:microsomal dipeptidase-like Zn-dependent dipeptidase